MCESAGDCGRCRVPGAKVEDGLFRVGEVVLDLLGLESEEIGENVLWYDPVPGQQKGCVPLSEAGNGKVMSL